MEEALQNYGSRTEIVIGVVAFFLVRLFIGWWASRKVTDAADFVVAGRGLPIYMTAASIMATWFAGETLMGASANGYRSGFHGVIFDPFGAVLCLLVSGVFFIRMMRRARYMTVVDFFENRFGPQVGLISSVVQIITYLTWTAAQIVGGGHILHALLGWPVWVGMTVIGVTVTLYTTLGGMLADTLLDFIQMFFTAAGISAVFYYVYQEVGGWPGLVENAGCQAGIDPFAMLPLADKGYLGYTGFMGWLYWCSAWLTVGMGSVATQDLMQRSMSARNEATSVWGSYFAAILYFTFGVMSPLVGIMVYKLNPNIAPDHIDSLLIETSIAYLPRIVNILFIAAMTSALMSTSDSSILAGASVVTENILPHFIKDIDDRMQLRWTRIMVLVIGFASIGLGAIIGETYKLAMISWSVLLVGLFVPFACGMYWKMANRNGALAASIGGFVTWLILFFYFLSETKLANTGEDGAIDLSTAIWDAVYIASTPAFLMSLILMVVASLLTQKSNPPIPLRDADGNLLVMNRRLGFVAIGDIFKPDEAPLVTPAEGQ